ncbi:MAG: hypothetical protein WDM96_09525 [Lacunisphaera sp.]
MATTGAITQVGSGGLIDAAVENAIKANGGVFAARAAAGVLANSLSIFSRAPRW